MPDAIEKLTAAMAAGDSKRAQQIKRHGKAMQQVAHMQAFSNAPVDEIPAGIMDKLPEIAQEAGVVAIVAELDYQGPDVETVDVTDRIVVQFNPSEKTLKIVADLRKHKPRPPVEALEIED